MKFKLVCACALFAFAVAATPAQEKYSMSGKCGKADVTQNIPAGDKEGIFSEHDEATGTHLKGWGVYVETFDSGDKVFYAYQTTGTTKDGAFASGGNKYQITGGTGKMKGIKGSGTCKLTGNAGGGLDHKCTGEYTLPAAAPAK